MTSPSPEVSSSNGAGRARLTIIQATVLATALIFSLQVRSFLDVKEAALWLGVLALWAAGLIAGHWPRAGFRALLPGWVTVAGVTLLGACIGDAPVPSLLEGLRLAALLAAATFAWDVLQDPDGLKGLFRAFLLTATLAAALALLQWSGLAPGMFPAFPHYDQTMYSVFGNQGLLAGYLAVALVILPGTLAANRWRLLYLPGGLLILGVLLLTGSRGGLLALAAGLGVRAVLDRRSRRACTVLLCAGALLAMLLAIGLESPPWSRWYDPDAELRPWIWRATTALAVEHLPWGAGLGQYSRVVPLHLGRAAIGATGGFNELLTEHAHFDGLEWFAETGLPGLAGLIWLFWRVRPRQAAPFSALVAALVFSACHPAFHSAPHALVGLLLLSACQSPYRPSEAASPARGRIVLALAGFPVLFGAASFALVELYPSWLLARAEAIHLAGGPARSAYERAVNAPGFHPEARESYGIFLYEQGAWPEALAQFEAARGGLESGRIYHLLAMAAERTGDYEGACRWYGECVARWPRNLEIQARRDARCSP